MASVCLYLQLHQPHRLRRVTIFDANSSQYFDDQLNLQILNDVADRCYIPATELMIDLIKRYDGMFRVSFSLTGVLLDQLGSHRPDVIEAFKRLVGTGCVELLDETYYHSLASMFSPQEFRDQVTMHRERVESLFGVTPRVFRNTELIYDNKLAETIAHWHEYEGVLAEGVDELLGARRPNYLYHSPGTNGDLGILLKHYQLSDDIAFRFSTPDWPDYPLTADKFADWALRLDGRLCNLFMDYETFGEHQRAETGIFKFLEDLPGKLLATGSIEFKTVSEAIEENLSVDGLGNADNSPDAFVYDVPEPSSWADSDRGVSAWLGNSMQIGATEELYALEDLVKSKGDPDLLEDWRRLTISDHVYYMCTKPEYPDDNAVHKYFNHYESPYDAYINFMNVVDHLRRRCGG